MKINIEFILILLACTACSCVSVKSIKTSSSHSPIAGLKLLGDYNIPFAKVFNNTTIGGLSGIDFDSANNCYYIISDDRSAINPARFYTVKIAISETGIHNIDFIGVTNLLQPGGNVYPNVLEDVRRAPDPEAIRYNPHRRHLVWTNEGERIVRDKDTILGDPSITMISPGGKCEGSFELPALFKMQSTSKGPRRNGVFEGMTFADDYKTLLVNSEEPLYEDGPRADTNENNAFIRILQFDTRTRKNTKQFAYKLDPVAHPPNPPNAFRINGVADILSIGNGQLLVVERSFSFGRTTCTIKLFIADLNVASDIRNHSSPGALQFTPATKKLLLNMDTLGIPVYNIEGVTFGPRLGNGNRTLLFIADNNFNKAETSQVLLFEVL
jgi:hypothetical protein